MLIVSTVWATVKKEISSMDRKATQNQPALSIDATRGSFSALVATDLPLVLEVLKRKKEDCRRAGPLQDRLTQDEGSP